jgi:hypothetical protein
MIQAGTVEVTRIRDLAMQVSREQAVSIDAAENARESIRTICKEASRFGLTTADVVRAVFRPALGDRASGCYCPPCRSRDRRLELGGLLSRDDLGDSAKQSPAA